MEYHDSYSLEHLSTPEPPPLLVYCTKQGSISQQSYFLTSSSLLPLTSFPYFFRNQIFRTPFNLLINFRNIIADNAEAYHNNASNQQNQ